MSKILLVEDDPDISSLEKDYLEMAGFQVELHADATGVISKVKNDNFDLVLLDVMLPGGNGFDLCRAIRKFSNLPIILVTAKNTSANIIHGLKLGSDDYISKPFDPAVLVARVKTAINRYHQYDQPSMKLFVDDISIFPDSRKVEKSGHDIKLTNKEYELLLFLIKHPNQAFTRIDLFETIWGLDSLTDEATVTVHINRLREKIEDDPSSPKIIETVWGIGYRLHKA